MFVPKRVLLVTRHIDFSIKLRESLERDGKFIVSAFASHNNALALQQHLPHAVAIVDVTVNDLPPEQMLRQLRTHQPDIALVLAPDTPQVREATASLNVQAYVTLPSPIRALTKTIEQAIEAMHAAQPDTAAMPRLDNVDETRSLHEEPPLVEGDTPVSDAQRNYEESLKRFAKLAAEEPPMPDFEESGTVRDFILAHDGEWIASSQEADETASAAQVVVTSASRQILAAQILEAAQDTSTPIAADNIREWADALLANVASEEQPMLKEPSFLVNLPQLPEQLEYTATTTSPSHSSMLNSAELETDKLAPTTRTRPPFDTPTEEATSEPAPSAEQPPVNPRVAQMVLVLTQLSLEMTAEALVLTQGQTIIAQQGELHESDIALLHPLIVEGWDDPQQQARMKYVNLPSNGTDYLLYSQRTPEGFILSLLFLGTLPLSVIRRQGNRLVEALMAIPDVVEEATAADEEPIVRPDVPTSPLSFAWLLRDPQASLPKSVTRQLEEKLTRALTQRGWLLHELTVAEDYVYLWADAPLAQSAQAHLHMLMQESAQHIADALPQTNASTLWADAYLMVTPGHALPVDDLQAFINFVRQ